MSTFGDRLREVRLAKGINQRELAQRLSMSRGTVSNLENGRCGCSIDMLDRLAQALRVSQIELLPSYRAITSPGNEPPSDGGEWVKFYHGELLALRRELDDMRTRAVGLAAQLAAEVARHADTAKKLQELEMDGDELGD